MFDYKIHITLDDYIHELEEKDYKDYLFTAPVGETLNNEMSDVYYRENAFVPYYRHKKGYETFAIDRGSVEITINGKGAIAETGDMIHIEPYMSHGLHFLKKGTIWRELFLGMNIYGGILEKRFIDRSYSEKLQDDAFMAEYRLKHHTIRLGEPEPGVVPREQLAQIRPKGRSIARFVFDGIVRNQKVGRHETGGEKEVWGFVMEKGIYVEQDSLHPDWDLHVVKEGRVEVTVLGGTFVANARDILHFPPYTNYSMKVLDHGTVVHVYNVKVLGLRLAEIVGEKPEGRQDLVDNWEDIREMFRQNNSCITKISRAQARAKNVLNSSCCQRKGEACAGKYVIRRLLPLIPVLLGVSFIIFTIMNMILGDVASLVLGDNAPLSAREELTRELGLDKPFWLRYVDHVLNALQGNFGLSYRIRTPMSTGIFSRFPTTMKLAAGAMLLPVTVGVPLGILSVVKQYSTLDVINSVIAMFFSSIPAFWLGLLSILLFALKLGWLSSNGADSFKSPILPIVTLALSGAAEILRPTRSTMLEVIRQDYTRATKAKGATSMVVIWKHALRNALLPVITVAGMYFGALLGSSMIIESVFAMPEVGTLAIDAIRSKDTPQVMVAVLMLAALFCIVMLIVDLLYTFIDPRIRLRYSKRGQKI